MKSGPYDENMDISFESFKDNDLLGINKSNKKPLLGKDSTNVQMTTATSVLEQDKATGSYFSP